MFESDNTQNTILLTRRQLLHKALLAVPVVMAFSPTSLLAKPVPSRRLSFSHLHTGEKLSVVYARNGEYLPEALKKINYFLRDFRCNEKCSIDPALLDILYDVQKEACNEDGVFQIISGYRSPRTNQMLAKKSKGVAKRSFHMQGKAVDIRLQGTKIRKLRDIAMDIQRGGVGYYPDSNFVHLDTGHFRFW